MSMSSAGFASRQAGQAVRAREPSHPTPQPRRRARRRGDQAQPCGL